MSLSLPQIATYVSYLFIIIAYTVKVVKIARMPFHLRWELYPIPHEKGYKHGGSYFEELEWWTKPRQKNRIRSILLKVRDYFTFPGYYRRNKGYWLGLYLWHIGFYLLMSFQILSFLGALLILTAGLIISVDSINMLGRTTYYLTLVVAVGAFIIGSSGSIVLLLKRLTNKELRAYATPADYFGYLFFLVLFLSGLFAWVYDTSLSSFREFWAGLIAFKYVDIQAPTYVFVMVFALHLIHLPFTRSTHYITKVFAFFGVLWDDVPDLKRSITEKNLKKVLSKPVSWSAPHIQSGKTWSEVVKGMPEDTTGTAKQ